MYNMLIYDDYEMYTNDGSLGTTRECRSGDRTVDRTVMGVVIEEEQRDDTIKRNEKRRRLSLERDISVNMMLQVEYIERSIEFGKCRSSLV